MYMLLLSRWVAKVDAAGMRLNGACFSTDSEKPFHSEFNGVGLAVEMAFHARTEMQWSSAAIFHGAGTA